MQNYIWCREDKSASCDGNGGTFATNNQGLCSNTTFWNANKTCEVFYNGGLKAALGKRCSGGAQQCIYPWYLSSNYFYEVSFLALLLDPVTNNLFFRITSNTPPSPARICLTGSSPLIRPAQRKNMLRCTMRLSALEQMVFISMTTQDMKITVTDLMTS